MLATARAGNDREIANELRGTSAVSRFDQKTCFILDNDLVHRTSSECDDRRARGHSLHRCQTKWLVPGNGKEERRCLSHELPRCRASQLSHAGDTRARALDARSDTLVVVFLVVDSTCDNQRSPGTLGNCNGLFNAFLWRDSTCKEQRGIFRD